MRKPPDWLQFIGTLLVLIAGATGAWATLKSDQAAMWQDLQSTKESNKEQFNRIIDRLDKVTDRLQDIAVLLSNKQDRPK